MTVNRLSGTKPIDNADSVAQRERMYQALARTGDEKAFESLLSRCQDSSASGSGAGESPTANPLSNASKNPHSALSSGLPQGTTNRAAESVLLSHAALAPGRSNLNSLCSGTPAGSAATSRAYVKNLGATVSPGAASGASAEDIGSLSAKFESGDRGIEAIGYDDTGGTSYGVYQISSKAGTMKVFLNFLDENAPNLAKRLRSAGPANTGGRSGKMPTEWKRIASEDPVRFEQLQKDFIEESHYQPARQEILNKTGVDVEKLPDALREVLWSTSVQHGPKGAAGIFCKAIGRMSKNGDKGLEGLIQSVYASRAKQFGQSTSEVRSSVASRFREEMRIALGMLGDGASPGRRTTDFVA